MIRLASLARWVPKPWEVPLRYHYHRWRGRLEPELDLLPALVTRDRRAIDVGANRGDYTYALARLARQVEAFEPLSDCAAVIEAARLPGVRVHRIALSDRQGQCMLHVPVRAGRADTGRASFVDPGGVTERKAVPVRTLDSYGFEDVGLIKIDVEGHESAVLAGAAATIRACRPVLVVEIEQRHRADCSIEEVFARILALGYAGTFLEAGRRQPLEAFSFQRHQAAFLAELQASEQDAAGSRVGVAFAAPRPSEPQPIAAREAATRVQPGGARYVNNFIFVPRP
jgi:FkbM family methyltransferase